LFIFFIGKIIIFNLFNKYYEKIYSLAFLLLIVLTGCLHYCPPGEKWGTVDPMTDGCYKVTTDAGKTCNKASDCEDRCIPHYHDVKNCNISDENTVCPGIKGECGGGGGCDIFFILEEGHIGTSPCD
jgi:hypothetical protein